MKFRIIEFKKSDRETGERFYVATGTKIKERGFLGLFWSKTIWNSYQDDKKEIVWLQSFENCIALIEAIKESLPIIHEVK